MKQLQDIVLERPAIGRCVGIGFERPVSAAGCVINAGHDDSSRMKYLSHAGETKVKLKE